GWAWARTHQSWPRTWRSTSWTRSGGTATAGPHRPPRACRRKRPRRCSTVRCWVGTCAGPTGSVRGWTTCAPAASPAEAGWKPPIGEPPRLLQGPALDRHVGLDLPPLEGHPLPPGYGEGPRAGGLRRTLQHGRDQLLLLPAAGAGDVRRMARQD